MKVEAAVLGSPSLISLMVSVDIKHHDRRTILTLYYCERQSHETVATDHNV